MSLAPFAPRTAPRAFAWYAALTILFTWPVAAGLARDVPADLGDPLLNCWIIGWNADHFLRALGGNPGALRELWHANIFYPDRYVLTYSELLLAQSAQALPVYALTGNLVLAYNLLLLSTFGLAGLGMFLLARAYTRDWRAAFLAGLMFGLMPYRISQLPHLQVMSSQWMPFALYGLHRFAAARSWRALVGGAVALVAQNLSCGYFLVYFSLFVPFFVGVEIVRTRTWRDWRVWAGFAGAAALVAVLTLPFMTPYLEARQFGTGRRATEEMRTFSADLLGWATADQRSRVWGEQLKTYPQPEGSLFPGLLPVVLFLAGYAPSRRVQSAFAHPDNGGVKGDAVFRCFLLCALIMAVYLSLGPEPRSGGQPINGPAVYPLLIRYVPGFDGLRVPARFATVAVLFLTLGAALGAQALLARVNRRSPMLLAALCAAWLVEAWAAPLPVNASAFTRAPGLYPPPQRVATGPPIPATYRFVTTLPGDAVLLALPLGNFAWDVQDVYYSTIHWRKLVNGFSGYIPARYLRLAALLEDPYAAPDEAWRALLASGATHVLVHGTAYATREPPAPYRWLEERGARVLAARGVDTIYEVTR